MKQAAEHQFDARFQGEARSAGQFYLLDDARAQGKCELGMVAQCSWGKIHELWAGQDAAMMGVLLDFALNIVAEHRLQLQKNGHSTNVELESGLKSEIVESEIAAGKRVVYRHKSRKTVQCAIRAIAATFGPENVFQTKIRRKLNAIVGFEVDVGAIA